MLKIINKISVEKEKHDNLEFTTKNTMKKNTILNTDTEKFFVLNINTYDNEKPKII